MTFTAWSADSQLISVLVLGNQLSLVPTVGRYGETTIYVTVTDADNLTDSQSFKASVLPVNVKPETMDLAWVVVDEDGSVEISLLGQDSNADQLTYSIVEMPKNGILSAIQTDQPNLIYQPYSNFYGVDRFTFQASDGEEISNTSTVKISVLPVNDPPEPVALTGENRIRTYLLQQSIQLKAIDVDGDELTFELIDQPKHGVLTGTLPKLIYNAPKDMAILDEFSFRVTDQKGGVETEKVEIERLFVPYKINIPAGFCLIHLPLSVMGNSPENINPVQRLSDLYQLIGDENINLLIGYDQQSRRWVSYFGNRPGGQTDLKIRPDSGILASMKNSVKLDLIGNLLPSSHQMALQRGLNLIGLPLNDNRINKISDLLTLPEIGNHISTLIIFDSDRFRAIAHADDRGGQTPLRGDLGMIVVCNKKLTFTLKGNSWLLPIDQ